MRKVIIGLLVVFLALGLIVGAFTGGFLAGRTLGKSEERAAITLPFPTPFDTPDADEESTPSANNGEINTDLLLEVLSIVKSTFYGEIPDGQTLAHGAIRGMLMTLDDPYTSFIEPEIAAILNEDTSGEFEGIGATVRMREDGYLEVVRPLPGHPAEAAGILAGDLILTVDDQSIIGMGLYEALSLIRGPENSQVVLEIARPGEEDTFTVTVTRARIAVPIVESRMLDEDIAYIRLTEFDSNATSAVKEALETLLDDNPKGLIFDLRDNPGGLLTQSIQVADLFLDEGIVAIERDSSGNEQEFGSYDGDLGEDIPMVVLINGGSASASEIVAGALQDRGRAPLIGETTLGKGSVQLPHNLSDGSQLRVTIARWFTPNDTSIHENGLAPDVEAPYPQDTPVEEDPQLDRAVTYLLEGK